MTAYAGETLTFKPRADSDAASVTVYVAGEGTSRESNATLDDGEWTAVIDASTSAAMPPGTYESQAKITDADGNVSIIPVGSFELLPSIAASGAQAVVKTWAEKALEAVEIVLADASQSANLSFSVDAVSMNFESRSQLLTYRNRLQRQVRMEKARARRPGAFAKPYVNVVPTGLDAF